MTVQRHALLLLILTEFAWGQMDSNHCVSTRMKMTWPDIDLAHSGSCAGECKVLVNFGGYYEPTCEAYCSTVVGYGCTNAWAKLGGNCEHRNNEQIEGGCSHKFTSDSGICECGGLEVPKPFSWTCEPSRRKLRWPSIDVPRSELCDGDCKVLVNWDNWGGRSEQTCGGYCESVGYKCTGSWLNDGNTCESRTRMENGCRAVQTESTICECGGRPVCPVETCSADRDCFSTQGCAAISRADNLHGIKSWEWSGSYANRCTDAANCATLCPQLHLCVDDEGEDEDKAEGEDEDKADGGDKDESESEGKGEDEDEDENKGKDEIKSEGEDENKSEGEDEDDATSNQPAPGEDNTQTAGDVDGKSKNDEAELAASMEPCEQQTSMVPVWVLVLVLVALIIVSIACFVMYRRLKQGPGTLTDTTKWTKVVDTNLDVDSASTSIEIQTLKGNQSLASPRSMGSSSAPSVINTDE